MPSRDGSLTELAINDWRQLQSQKQEQERQQPLAQPLPSFERRDSASRAALNNNWLARINAAKAEKLQYKSLVTSLARTSDTLQGSFADSLSISDARKLQTSAPEQKSLELAKIQKQAEADAKGPLKVPLPGPRPQEEQQGKSVRPKPGLWTALGGGIAVVLNEYRAVGGPGESEETKVEKGALKTPHHAACVMSVAWNGDGSQFVTGDIKGVAIVWDVVSGQPARQLNLPSGGLQGIFRVDWNSKLQQVACCGNEGKVIVWDAETGVVKHEMVGHNTYGAVRTCKYSPDGTMLASGGDFGILIVWSSETGKPVKTMTGHSDHVNTCSWSPDSKRIVSGSADNLLMVMDVERSTEPMILHDHTASGAGDLDGITCVQWNPMGHSIASSGRDMHVIIHDAKLGKIRHNLVGHVAPIMSCSWCCNGTKLASCAKDRMVIIWDADGGAALHTLVGHHLSAKTCSWHPEGNRLVTAAADGRLLVWDVEAGTAVQELESMQERALKASNTLPLEGIEMAVFSPDGSIIVSVGGGGEVVIWDGIMCATVQKIMHNKEDSISRCYWSPDSTKIASGCANGTVVLWNAKTSKEIRRFKAHTEAVSGCEFGPDSTLLATSSGDGKLIVWDVATGDKKCCCEGHEGPIARSEWSPDGSKLVSSGADGKVCVWDAATGAAIHMQKQHRGASPCCSWSPNGKLIISCGWYDRSVLVWKAETGQVMHYMRGHTGAVTVCRFSPDGRRVVSGGARGEVIVWDALTGSVTALLRADHDASEGCAFSPDGRMILSYDSQTITVWVAAASKPQAGKAREAGVWELMLQVEGHQATISKCQWSPDSRFILSAGRDKRVVVWEVATGEPLYHLDGHQAGVCYCSWSPEGTSVLSGDEESCLMLWGNLPRYSYMAAPGPTLFYFRIRRMHGTFQKDLANATATAHPSVLTASTAEGTTLLHLAAQYTDLELLMWMLSFAAEHSFTLGIANDCGGSSPLDYAVQNQWWQGMGKMVGAIHAGIMHMSMDLQKSLFTSTAFKILLRHFASKLEPLLQEGSACGVSSVSNSFTVSDLSGILLQLGQEGISMVVAGSNHRLIPPSEMQAFWQQALLDRAAQKRTRFGANKLDKEVDATAVVRLQRVGWAGCAAQAPNGILHSLLRSEVSAHMYGLPVVRAVIDLKWWSFARKYVLKELALYTLLLAMFTAYALVLSETNVYGDEEKAQAVAGSNRRGPSFSDVFIPCMAVSVLALIVRFLTHELRQMQTYGRHHWASFWNWMNAFAFSLFIPVVLMHACGLRNTGVFKVLLATDAVLLWANLLHFAKAFRGTGALVQMVTMTVSDMRWFVLLLFVVMFGFGTSFLVLFSGNKEPSPEFADVDNALLSMFLFMLGSFNMEAFDLAAVPSAAILLFVFYEVVVTVVLLNLLIAIMGESFSKVVANEEQQFLKGRAELIDEVEIAVLGRQAAHDNSSTWFPRYLHILRPGQQSVGGEDALDDPWVPALARTEARVEEMLARLQSAIQDQFSSQVGEAVSTELYRFLEQPLSSLTNSSWELDMTDGTATPNDVVQALDAIPARSDALRTKPFRL